MRLIFGWFSLARLLPVEDFEASVGRIIITFTSSTFGYEKERRKEKKRKVKET